MSKLKIEYLIHFDDRTKLSNSDKFLKSLLELNEELTIEADKITYKDIVVDYIIKVNKTEKGRFFELKIIYKDADIQTRIEACHNLESAINEAIYCLNKVKVYTLWNDLSFNYSKQAYPLIYEVENLMRQLITKFMVINVGAEWSKTDLTDSIRKQAKSSTNAIDILYELDFIHLSEVLLNSQKPKSNTEDIKKVHQKIMQANTSSELDINELKNIVPQSNWQKYFSALIQCDTGELEKSWEDLYKLRCKVAHNNFITKTDYQKILRLTEELKVKLQEALEKLDEVEVPEEDKEAIIENVSDDIVNQLIESELKDFNINRVSKIVSSTGISRMSRLVRMSSVVGGIDRARDIITEITRGIDIAENQMSNRVGGMGIDRVKDKMPEITRGMHWGLDRAEKSINSMSMFADGMGITSAQKQKFRDARVQVNDEVDESLTTVQNVKNEDEEHLEALIQNDNKLISETEDSRQTSLEDESHE